MGPSLPILNPRPLRSEIPQGECVCDYCIGKCCRYFALAIDTPTTGKDFGHIRWYLAHQDVSVFVDEGTWYLMLHRVCNHLLPDNRCAIYFNRPSICREYSTENCEYDEDTTYDKIFENDDQFVEYLEAVYGPDRIDPETSEVMM